MAMLHFDPKELEVRQVHQFLLGGVAPRPIALASTMSADGLPNLSPFSFFNAFGANPPVVAFSPSRRGRDASTKDTYNNLIATREVVIQAVTYDMVEQVNLASTEFPSDVDEFARSGLTPIPSDIVKPYRVEQSPFQMECRLHEMVSVGDGPASANIAVCEVLRFHIAEDILLDGIIEPESIDLVGRNGGNYYTRASGGAIFAVAKPTGRDAVGFDNLPVHLKNSHVLSANNLAQLANTDRLPSDDEVQEFLASVETVEADPSAFHRFMRLGDYHEMFAVALACLKARHGDAHWMVEQSARTALDFGDTEFAWMMAMACPAGSQA
jgi:flavin reductase (DIM6/NTAB) family NADH-FMN oxidoreductase RutF